MKTPIELRVKYLSLSAEQKIIRRLELRLKRSMRRCKSAEYRLEFALSHKSIYEHRVNAVRQEARATHLARMFLKGTAYLAVERVCYTKPPMKKALDLAIRYGGQDSRVLTQKFEQWMQGE